MKISKIVLLVVGLAIQSFAFASESPECVSFAGKWKATNANLYLTVEQAGCEVLAYTLNVDDVVGPRVVAVFGQQVDSTTTYARPFFGTIAVMSRTTTDWNFEDKTGFSIDARYLVTRYIEGGQIVEEKSASRSDWSFNGQQLVVVQTDQNVSGEVTATIVYDRVE